MKVEHVEVVIDPKESMGGVINYYDIAGKCTEFQPEKCLDLMLEAELKEYAVDYIKWITRAKVHSCEVVDENN